MRASRTDSNHAEIVNAFRSCGATVQTLHAVGRGCPDLLIGFGGSNFLVEVKDGAKSPSRRKLTPDQVRWHETWRGRVAIVEDAEAVIAVLEANGEATDREGSLHENCRVANFVQTRHFPRGPVSR